MPMGVGDFDFSKTVLRPIAGQTYRVFVQVWNLGRMGAYGARLRVWWVEPGFFDGTTSALYQPHYIGGRYLDLSDRGSTASHRVAEINAPWTVVMNYAAHECLLAVLECATDPWDGELASNSHRHVAQRNLSLVQGKQPLDPLLAQLGARLSARYQRLQITASSVSRAGFVGSQQRGLASTAEPPAGWNHGGLVFGVENRVIAELQGMPVRRDGPARPDLPGISLSELLLTTLGLKNLAAQTILGKLDSPTAPQVLRFILTDESGQTGGYSMIVTP